MMKRLALFLVVVVGGVVVVGTSQMNHESTFVQPDPKTVSQG